MLFRQRRFTPEFGDFAPQLHSECDISVSKLLGFETFLFFFMVSVSVSEIFGIVKSIGIGFEKIWYRKKYRYRFRKKLVSKKVLVSVSKIFVLKKDTNIHDLFHHLEP